MQLGTAHREEVLAQIESFTSPPTLNLVEAPGTLRQLRASAALTDLSGYVTSQHWAHNADGTRVPYLHVSRGAAGKDGPQSLMLYAYGGFGLTNTPKYFSAFIGCDALLPWLGAGGDFVIAFPRGGGELGPGWHSAAVGEHRQRSFDDVYAVANDLIERRVTSNERLAVAGLSNGGLMASVALTQRPELFRAVLVGVPLTDMLRYHLLLSGPAWMPEYGDPNDPKMRQTLLAYSPLHNVFEARRYPEALFYATSTDDRVHPGHARRMVAKLRATGNPVLYFEPDAGGHAGSASPKQSATMAAVQATYLFQKTGLWPKDVRSLSGEIVPSSTRR